MNRKRKAYIDVIWRPEFSLTGQVNLKMKIKDLFSDVVPAPRNPQISSQREPESLFGHNRPCISVIIPCINMYVLHVSQRSEVGVDGGEMVIRSRLQKHFS